MFRTFKTAKLRICEGEPDPDPKPEPKGVQFTPEQQAHLNTLLAREKRDAQAKNKILLDQLEQIKTTAQLTQTEKEALETQMEELRQRSMSAEELTKQATDKIKKESEVQLESVKQNASRWESQYKNTLIQNAIVDAAIKSEAHSPQQIIAILRPTAKVVEKNGPDGKPSGEFETRVMFHGKNDKGEPVTLDLTAIEAVKQMRESPDEYGNLFKDFTKGGVGAPIGEGKGGRLTAAQIAALTPDQFRKLRKEKPDLFN